MCAEELAPFLDVPPLEESRVSFIHPFYSLGTSFIWEFRRMFDC